MVLCALAASVALGANDDKPAAYENPQQAVAAKPDAKPRRFEQIKPQIPAANRYERGKVFLENADELLFNEERNSDYQVLRGNVKFSRSGMFMYCDSAYFYPETSSLDAFGSVRMTRGADVEARAEIMHYYGDQEYAELRHNVMLRNNTMTLTTDSLDYIIQENKGYYFNGGRLVDNRNNVLTSEVGTYNTQTKDAEFSTGVALHNPKFDMRTNTLLYNTATHLATIVEETEIYSKEGNTIYTSNGVYNTSNDHGTLYDRSRIIAKDGKHMVGDTLFYDRKQGYGMARGNIVMTDPEHDLILDGDFGYHNENTHLSYVTRRARARLVSESRDDMGYLHHDTLHVHADTLRTFLDEDSLRVLTAQHRVKYYRDDLQGLCDSAAFAERDSILNMYRHAVVWNTNRQIVGDTIKVHMNDSTPDWALLPSGGVMGEHLGENYYNQLSGKKIKALFENKEMRHLFVDGNVQVIFYPEERDSTVNKQVNAESSYLTIDLKEKQEVDKIKMWPDVSGSVTPLYLLKNSALYLQGFQWFGALRPASPADVMNDDLDLSELLNAPSPGRRRVVSPSP